MKKSFTLLLALVASLTGLMADDIQFTNLPYIHYGDSVRVQATTSLPDMPMPTNYEYGFEYEYKNSDGNSGGGGVEPCAIVNGHMEAILKKTDIYSSYRYRPYYVLNSWTGERATGEWIEVSEWMGLNAILFTNLPYIHYGDSVRVQATTSLPDMPMPTNLEYGFEYEYTSADGNSGGGGVEPCAIVNGHMEAVLKKSTSIYQSYRYRPYYITDDYTGARIVGEWVDIPEWEVIINGVCGENLTWSLNQQTGVLSINGEGDMDNASSVPWSPYRSDIKTVVMAETVTSIRDNAFDNCENLTTVHIPSNVHYIGRFAFAFTSIQTIRIPDNVTTIKSNTFRQCYRLSNVIIGKNVTTIEQSAFYYCASLKSITLPSKVESIAHQAFYYCSNMESLTCLATTPPLLTGQYTFDRVVVNGSYTLYVPAGSEEQYRATAQWNSFTYIMPIGQAQTVDIEDIQAEPTDNSVVLEWPAIENAVVYTIEIRKNGELICTLSFNANGQLQNVQFAMPARNRANSPQRAAETTTGWTYTIAGLEANTAYTYTVVATDSSNQEVYNETIPFTTQPQNTPTDVERTEASDTPNKILHNGQIFILRDNKTYTLQGQEVK